MSKSDITIDDVFPWGRSLDEYRRMFSLTEADLDRRILGCADGPAAFNAAMRRRGGHVVSCDPFYHVSAEQIRRRVEATHDLMVERVTRDAHRFVWSSISSPQEMGRLRVASMMEFLADYEAGQREGRYLTTALPKLDLADDSFDLALCSHFLFLYSDEFDAEFHIAAISEMLRVAGEARIFPLLDMQSQKSRHLPAVLDVFDAEVVNVNYEFQRGANAMLRLKKG